MYPSKGSIVLLSLLGVEAGVEVGIKCERMLIVHGILEVFLDAESVRSGNEMVNDLNRECGPSKGAKNKSFGRRRGSSDKQCSWKKGNKKHHKSVSKESAKFGKSSLKQSTGSVLGTIDEDEQENSVERITEPQMMNESARNSDSKETLADDTKREESGTEGVNIVEPPCEVSNEESITDFGTSAEDVINEKIRNMLEDVVEFEHENLIENLSVDGWQSEGASEVSYVKQSGYHDFLIFKGQNEISVDFELKESEVLMNISGQLVFLFNIFKHILASSKM